MRNFFKAFFCSGHPPHLGHYCVVVWWLVLADIKSLNLHDESQVQPIEAISVHNKLKMAIFMKAEWLLLLHYSIVLMLTFHLRISTAAPTSLAPDNVKGSTAAEQSSQPIHIHHQYLREFFRCLTLRDDGADLSAAGCIPAVFSTMDSVPSDVESDTVSGYLSKGIALILDCLFVI